MFVSCISLKYIYLCSTKVTEKFHCPREGGNWIMWKRDYLGLYYQINSEDGTAVLHSGGAAAIVLLSACVKKKLWKNYFRFKLLRKCCLHLTLDQHTGSHWNWQEGRHREERKGIICAGKSKWRSWHQGAGHVVWSYTLNLFFSYLAA